MAEQGDTLRAAQIQAVRDAMGWGEQPDAFNEQAVADTAAELVDAVLAAAGKPQDAPDGHLGPRMPALGAAATRALEVLGEDADGEYLTPAEQRAMRDQAEARGYAAAVAELRDVTQRTGSPAARWAADYLEAVGPRQGQAGDGVARELEELRRRVAEYEAAITWHVDCLGCSKRLDTLYAERAAGYEEGLRDAREGKIDALLPDGTHRYWSTHCRHGRHEDCSATELTGEDVNAPEGGMVRIERTPAQCKTCAAPCICPCHEKSHG